jgi:DNA-binding beta-propeller fold protein YncE
MIRRPSPAEPRARSCPRTAPHLLAAIGLSVVVFASGACSGSSGGDGSQGTVTTTTEATTTSTAPKPVSDQSGPKSTFGLAFDDHRLWVTDFYAGQILGIDPENGSILKRYKGEDGVPEGVDDIAIGPDGSLYYTGFNDGSIGRMSPNNVSVVIDGLGAPGAGPIAFSRDGRLYVGRAVIGDGLWEIDPKGENRNKPLMDTMGNVNAFAVGADGMLYGPRFGLGDKGALVRIDPNSKQISELVAGFDSPVAVKLNRESTKAYVLSQNPGRKPTVSVVDLDSKKVTALAEVATPLADNLAIANDGKVYVSSFNQPVLTVIDPDGTTRTLTIGEH